MPKTISPKKAIEIAIVLEAFAVRQGAHIALTGGCLYKSPLGFPEKIERKDADFILYRVRQVDCICLSGFLADLEKAGFKLLWGASFCFKFEYDGYRLDILIPEEHAVDEYREPDEPFHDPEQEDPRETSYHR